VFFLSLAVGGVFFLLINYCVRAGWAVAVRRVAEAMAKTMWLFVVLALPLLWTITRNDGLVWRWAQPVHEEHVEGGAAEPVKKEMASEKKEAVAGEHAAAAKHEGAGGHEGEDETSGKMIVGRFGDQREAPEKPLKYVVPNPETLDESGHPESPDEAVAGKVKSWLFLNPTSWMLQVLVSLVALTGVAWFYAGSSSKQDKTGDERITARLNTFAPPGLVVFGLAVTLVAYQLIMSLDPNWFSTIFGGYYFAGSAICVMAMTILVCQILQSQGYLKRSINVEHYHDLSKFQFAFTFFWGYLAFSQFMLQWYSSQPEELTWFSKRGCSTALMHSETFGTWAIVSMCLLFGKLLIPFGGLLSRHVKRAPAGRIFFALWILAFQYVDMYWCVMPELDGGFHFGLPEVAAFVGVGGLFVGLMVMYLKGSALIPVKDPRIGESLAFHQMF
jgi:hypothetical protein